MAADLYERDALAWAEQQADLLRRLAEGKRVNAAVDWPHVIEEVRDVGLSELRAMVHLLKLYAWPSSPARAHWREQAGTFLDDARRRFAPSMRQRIDLDDLYATALRRARSVFEDGSVASLPLPETGPFALEELLEGDVTGLVARLAASSRPLP